MMRVMWRGEEMDSNSLDVKVITTVEPVCRIDSDERGVDDVAIEGVQMARFERMSKRSWWTAMYMPDGSRHVFWIYASKKGVITVEHRLEAAL